MNISSQPTIFICEFITAGGFLGEALPDKLVKEGLLMRDTLIADLASDANIITTHDYRISPAKDCESVRLLDMVDVWQQWAQCMSAAEVDYAWIIAPETDGILLKLTEMALASNKLVIGAGLDAIALTSDKQKTHDYLTRLHIPTVHTQNYDTAILDDNLWVLKPSDGVGAENVFMGEPEQLHLLLEQHALDSSQFIVQPYIKGMPASISVMSYAQSFIVLSYNLQYVEKTQGHLYYQGGELNGAFAYKSVMNALVERILAAIPSLQGYWGVDVVIDTETQQLTVIEINPRLTTSYTKLSEATGLNPAECILASFKQEKLLVPNIQYNPVSFYV